jgi:hypothetical protein
MMFHSSAFQTSFPHYLSGLFKAVFVFAHFLHSFIGAFTVWFGAASHRLL